MKILLHYLSNADLLTVGLAILILFLLIMLIITHAVIGKKGKSFGVWRLMCLAPLLLCIAHFILRYFSGASGFALTLQLYGVMYLSAVIIALWQFFAKRKHGHRITAVIATLLVICFSAFTLISALMLNVENHSRQNYVESFKGTISTLKHKYVLEDWKEIDFDALAAELLPKVERAQADNDAAGFMAVLCELQYNMYDGHVTIEAMNPETYREALDRLLGDDHGFSMITLDNGDTVAVLVDEASEAHSAGVRNGTVITMWNGESISAAKAAVRCIHPEMSFPVKQNEEMFQAAFLAGRGGERVEIAFIDESGAEITATVSGNGSYAERFARYCDMFAAARSARENFHASMISNDCGYLVINSEEYHIIKDITCIFTGKYPEITELVGKKLAELKAQGMTKLIIDLRNNTGGMDEISGAVTALFTDEPLYVNGMGKAVDGGYEHIFKHYVNPVGTYKDMPVVVLINYMCMSAGDGLAYDLSRCPNVTLMGMTQPCGVNQFTGGCIATSGSEFMLYYPTMLSLDEAGQIFIDTDSDRISRNPVDALIPVTASAASAIFGEENVDYELDYALDYINQIN